MQHDRSKTQQGLNAYISLPNMATYLVILHSLKSLLLLCTSKYSEYNIIIMCALPFSTHAHAAKYLYMKIFVYTCNI